ncbi:hypothetical protein BH23VER1_BH23VER1_08130 [soil metagenome]
MKKFLTILTCVFATAGLSVAAEAEFPDISINELNKAIEAKEVAVIDVMGTNSYKAGHIPTAIDYASKKKELAKALPEDKDTLIVAYCGGPACSAYKQAAVAAKELGYKNIKHLSAGISGWKEADMPTETGTKEDKEEKKADS